MPVKSVQMKISKNNSHDPRIVQPKNQLPRPKGVPYSPRKDRQTDTHTHTHTHTHRQTDTQGDYCGHPFRVSGFFPSTYHQGSAQY